MCFSRQNTSKPCVEFRRISSRNQKKRRETSYFVEFRRFFFLVFLVNFDIFWYILVDIDRNRFRCSNKTKKTVKNQFVCLSPYRCWKLELSADVGQLHEGCRCLPSFPFAVAHIYTCCSVRSCSFVGGEFESKTLTKLDFVLDLCDLCGFLCSQLWLKWIWDRGLEPWVAQVWLVAFSGWRVSRNQQECLLWRHLGPVCSRFRHCIIHCMFVLCGTILISNMHICFFGGFLADKKNKWV